MARAILAFLCVIVAGVAARAGVLMDFDAAVYQDALTTASTETVTHFLVGAGLYVPVENKGRFYLGATYLNGTASETVTAGTTSVAHQDIILGFKWFIGRGKIFVLSAGYGFLSTATYQDPTGVASEAWTGTSTFAKFTVAPEFATDFNLGLSLIYYAGSYSEKKVSNAVSDIANSRAVIIPALSMSYRW